MTDPLEILAKRADEYGISFGALPEVAGAFFRLRDFALSHLGNYARLLEACEKCEAALLRDETAVDIARQAIALDVARTAIAKALTEMRS